MFLGMLAERFFGCSLEPAVVDGQTDATGQVDSLGHVVLAEVATRSRLPQGE